MWKKLKYQYSVSVYFREKHMKKPANRADLKNDQVKQSSKAKLKICIKQILASKYTNLGINNQFKMKKCTSTQF